VSGVPSATSTIVDVTVGGGNGFQFVPDTLNISVGDTVRWTWANSGHSVTSGPPCVADSQYCSPNDMNCASGILSNMGTVYTHTFAVPGSYSYHCAVHCGIGMTGVVNVSGGCAPSGWSAGGTSPTPGSALLACIFRPMESFYAMGGRDASNVEFTHPFEYDPVTNMWTMKLASYPDTITNNIACGVLAESGTPYIYCVGGSQFGTNLVTGRVFRYDPSLTASLPLLLPGHLASTLCPEASRYFRISCIFWAGSITPLPATRPTRSGSYSSYHLGTEDRCPACSARLHTDHHHRQPNLHRWRRRYHGWRSHRHYKLFCL